MTLVITQVDRNGIVMVADSAVTNAQFNPPRVLIGVQKLFPVPSLNAGLSCWGAGPENEYFDIWMRKFVDHAGTTCCNVPELAKCLATQLNADVAEWCDGKPNTGVHVAGYHNGSPDYWHVHNGPSDADEKVNVTRVNANHDLTPEKLAEGRITRNGDFKRYAVLAEALDVALARLHHHYILRIPRDPNDLHLVLALLKEHVRITGSLWKLSDQPPSIGGPIHGLIICQEKIIHYDDGVSTRTHELEE